MMRTEGKRTRPGDLFLLVLLLANLVCGVGIIGALRSDLSKDLVAAESTLASSKISAYLWGKILRFISAMENGKRVGEGAPFKWEGDALTVVDDLPAESNFQRIRSGAGESLPVFMGTPKDLPNRGHVLPLAVLVAGGTSQDQHYVIGAISLANVDGYLGDLRRRGIHCRIVDPEGNILFGASGEFQGRRDSASLFEGGAPLMGGALIVAQRIKLEIAGHNFIQNAIYPVHLTVSIGIYRSEDGDVTEDQIVSLADAASYIAKKAGKNQVVVKTSA